MRQLIAIITAILISSTLWAGDIEMTKKDIEVVTVKIQALNWEWNYNQERLKAIQVLSNSLKAELRRLEALEKEQADKKPDKKKKVSNIIIHPMSGDK